VIGNQIYVGGGCGGAKSVEVYNGTMWLTKSALPDLCYVSGTMVDTNKFAVYGAGWGSIVIYDPAADSYGYSSGNIVSARLSPAVGSF
jgi:hypothetical protein